MTPMKSRPASSCRPNKSTCSSISNRTCRSELNVMTRDPENTATRDTECYAGHATQHEKLYCPDRPVPPKLEMNISPEGLIQSPAEYSRSLLATTHRCRSWAFGLKPSGTVPICSPLHDPEILAVTLYRFIATRPPMRANCISPPLVATETKLRDTECYLLARATA